MALTDKLDAWWVAKSAAAKLNEVKAAAQNARSNVQEFLSACAGWTPDEIAAIDPEIVAVATTLRNKCQALVDALSADEQAFLDWRP